MLNAPAAVEWFTDASPNEHTTTASPGHAGIVHPRQAPSPGPAPSRPERPSANASPTARGRCEAIVEVCGMTDSAALPNTLCRPPAIGSAAAATRPSSTSRSPSPAGRPAWADRAR